MGQTQSEEYYRPISVPEQAFEIILTENPDLTKEEKRLLRTLRTQIYKILKEQNDVQITVSAVNSSKSFRFQLGSGLKSLKVDISEDGIQTAFLE